jgi:hypothetical protein
MRTAGTCEIPSADLPASTSVWRALWSSGKIFAQFHLVGETWNVGAIQIAREPPSGCATSTKDSIVKEPLRPLSLCIGALLVAGSPCSDGQTSPVPAPTASSTKLPINSPDDRFFLYEGPSTHAVGSVSNFVHDSPRVIAKLPYSAVGTTESFGTLGDWGTATNTVKIRYLRDGQGRTRAQDVSHPGDAPQGEVIRIDDPVGGQRYMLFPNEKSMFVLPFVNAAGAVVQQPLAPPPPTEASLQRFLKEFGGDAARAPGKPVAETRLLGKRTFDGISAVGERRAYTLPGKDAQIRIESEQWFSPELDVVVMNALSVWVNPKANMKVTYRLQITRGEPDPTLFRVPEDYMARDMDR